MIPSLPKAPIAVLLSGGIDSAVLLGDLLSQGGGVHPLFVRCGLRWEQDELTSIKRLLSEMAAPNLHPLVVLNAPVGDLYGQHWSIAGGGVPDEATDDDAVYLPGRNVLLLTKSMLWCHLHDVPAVALAVLRGNPFADSTPEFVTSLQAAVNQGIHGQVSVQRPYATLSKGDVLARANGVPLALTHSCLRSVGGLHCGRCNKCAERQKAFAAARRIDPTEYAKGGTAI
ncbi:MAG: 7-cyano-7-deazaguanine synthase [Planctomycetes bacterium]|nr:7-cyano-7-deazaguanine synthase [Planctomycetota bacterium]